MRRTLATAIVLVLGVIHTYALGDEEPPATAAASSESIGIDAEAERDPNLPLMAVVRLYRDWQADRRAYTTVTVPLEGFDVVFDAVATQADAGAGIENAVVAVVPEDQQDPVVETMMNGHIFADPYRAGHGFSLQAGEFREFLLLPCVFVDPLREPLANAEVEIWVGDSNYDLSSGRKIWIANVRLDANGRMPSPRTAIHTRLRCVLFVVLHPDCGPVQARMFPASRKERKFMVSALAKDKWCVFVDALGHPMAGAKVEVIPSATWSSGQSRVESWSSIALDEAGRLRPPHLNSTLQGCSFLVHDPNYGMGIVEPSIGVYRPEEPPSLSVVPLTAVGTRADERSIWGTVVDANEEPVAAAVIECSEVCTPGRGRLKAWWPRRATWDKPAKVLTDAQGTFAMHLPLATDEGRLGRPVPPGASYEVMIHAPKALDFEPFRGLLAAGQEHTIVLQRKPQGPQAFSGVLAFEDEFGPVADPEMLKKVVLSIRFRSPQGHSGGVAYEGSWMEKKDLPFGTYSASATWNGKTYFFGPIEVTSESPDTIVFEPVEIQPAFLLYRGRVVHGVTGAPVSQAIVMQNPAPPGRLGLRLKSEHRKQILYFGPEVDPKSEFFQALCGLDLGVARTDSQGRFEIALPTDLEDLSLESVVAIREDYLGAEQSLLWYEQDSAGVRHPCGLEPDDSGAISLPEMRLFPAGAILIEPNVPSGQGLAVERDVRFFWYTKEGDPTPWLKDLWAARSENRGGCIFRKSKLPSNEPSRVYVPADVELTVKMTRRDPQFAPAILEDVLLRQGEVLDLGRVDFPSAMKVAVRVIDSAGKPLEGISVQHRSGRGNYWGQQAVTDQDGVVHLYVAQHAAGQFVVEYYDDEAMSRVREGVPYTVGGAEDAGREFVVQLSEAFLERLRRSRPGV